MCCDCDDTRARCSRILVGHARMRRCILATPSTTVRDVLIAVRHRVCCRKHTTRARGNRKGLGSVRLGRAGRCDGAARHPHAVCLCVSMCVLFSHDHRRRRQAPAPVQHRPTLAHIRLSESLCAILLRVCTAHSWVKRIMLHTHICCTAMPSTSRRSSPL